MDIKRGLIRLWILFSVIWVLGVALLIGPDWCRAALHWYRVLGFEAVETRPCPGWVGLDEKKAFTLKELYASRIRCFHVTLPSGSRYILRVMTIQYSSKREIKNLIAYNAELLFPPTTSLPPTMESRDPMIIDLVNRDTSAFRIGDRRDLGLIMFLTIMGLAAPVAVFALGAVVWRIAASFRAR